MSNVLQVKVTTNSQGNFQGTVTLPGLKPTKLVRKSDKSTEYGTRSAVLASARNVAKKFGFDGIEIQENKTKTTTTIRSRGTTTRSRGTNTSRSRATRT